MGKSATGLQHARNAIQLSGVYCLGWRRSAALGCFAEIAMRTSFKVLAAVIAVLAAGTSGAAMAKYPCAPGYRYHNRVCQPVRHLGYGNPVSGAVSGEAAGAARGAATGGPVGAVVGGALGTASGALTGTGNMLSPAR
jgi:hypothetical protein